MTSLIPCAGPAHVLYRVSELANVKSLTSWSNTKAKILGKLCKYSIHSNTAYIESVADPDGTFTVKADLSTVDRCGLENNIQVVVFGELVILQDSIVIIAKIVKECNSLDMTEYYKAMQDVQRQFPRVLK